jgi:hypothetical protein
MDDIRLLSLGLHLESIAGSLLEMRRLQEEIGGTTEDFNSDLLAVLRDIRAELIAIGEVLIATAAPIRK